jgi:putative transcriptional regulator (Ypuh-like)
MPRTETKASSADTRALEALLFVSDEPLTPSVIAQSLEVDRKTADALCDRLAKELEDRGAGVLLRNVAGGWRLFTHPDTAPEVERFVLSSRQARLTKAALETRPPGQGTRRGGGTGGDPGPADPARDDADVLGTTRAPFPRRAAFIGSSPRRRRGGVGREPGGGSSSHGRRAGRSLRVARAGRASPASPRARGLRIASQL